MALPTVTETLQIHPPVFIRKLRRRSDWGDPSDEQSQRAKDACEKLFKSQLESDISVYLVSNDDDLRRVALGMNSGRDSLKEAVPFVAFLPEELETLKIQTKHTPGNLPCVHANFLHYDMAGNDSQLIGLCDLAMKKGRIAANCTSGMMRDVLGEATKERCRTASEEGVCVVVSCDTVST